MQSNEQFAEYEALAKKLIRRKKWIMAITVVLVLLVILVCSPIKIAIDKTYVDYKGVNPVVTVLLVLLIFFFEFIAIAFSLTPLTTSITEECDPQKYLYLNTTVNNASKRFDIYAAALFYMGDFSGALNYANKMIASGKKGFVLIGLFNKARCEFFLNDFEALKQTVIQYENAMKSFRLNAKDKLACDRYQSILNLLVAMAEGEKEKMARYAAEVKSWNKSKAIEGFIDYLKGVVAYSLDNKTNALYHLMAVKTNCSKTVFATLADAYLEKFN